MNIQTMEPASLAELVRPLLINVDAPGCGTLVVPGRTEEDFHGDSVVSKGFLAQSAYFSTQTHSIEPCAPISLLDRRVPQR